MVRRRKDAVAAESLSSARRAPEALAAGKAKARALDFTWDWEYWLDKDGSFIYVSPSSERITGHAPEEFLTDPELLLRIVHPDDRETVKKHLDERLAGDREPCGLEFRIVLPSGETRWMGHACQAVLDDDGADLGIRASNRDITAHRLANEAVTEALRASEERWRSLTESSPDHIVTLGRDLDIEFVNFASPGLTVEELIGTPLWSYVEKERQEEIRAIHQRVLLTGTEESYETVFRPPDGDPIHYESRVVARRDPRNGDIVGLTVSARDISDRKRTVDRLRESEARYRGLFESMLEGFAYCQMVYDEQGHPVDFTVLATNPSVAALTGLTDVAGKRASEAVPGIEERLPEILEITARVVSTGRPERFETNFSPLSMWLEVGVSRLAEGHFVAVFTDITERRRAEDALRLTQISVDRAADMIHWIAPDGRLLYVSDSVCSRHGCSRERMLEKTIFDIDPALSAEVWSRHWQELKERGSVTLERTHRTESGEEFPVEVTANHVAHEGKEYDFAFARDVTERKRAEEALRRQAAALDQVHEAIIATDLAGLIVQWNPGAETLFGYSAEEALGEPITLIWPQDQLSFLAEEIHPRVKQRGWHQTEARLCGKSGEEFPVYLTLATLKDTDGVVIGFVGSATDITERKRAEQEIAAGAERLRRTLKDTVKAMGAIVELRDPYTAGHERRVTRLAEAIAVEMGIDEEVREGLAMAGEVHDIGKIGVPAEILSKPSKLTDMEFDLVKQHPVLGRTLVATIDFARPVAQIVGQHHERLDGSGYPDGLTSEEILLEARVLAVADVVEAMASHRPYRPALGIEPALDEIHRGAGTLYDADAVAACERVIAAGYDLADRADGR